MTDDDLRRVLAELEAQDHALEAPPPAVWDRIRAEIDADHEAVAVADPAAAGDEPPAPASDATAVPPARPSWVVPMPEARDRRPSRGSWTARVPGLAVAAAAVLLVAAIGAGWAVTRGAAGEQVLAEAVLDPLDDRGTTTSAQLVDLGGHHELVLDVQLPPTDGHYEVWLLAPDVSDMVSLGPVAADGRYALPVGTSTDALPVVDVSAEPADGDAGHSGDSVLRGTLEPSA